MPKLNSMFKKTTYITLSNRRQSIRQDAMVTEKELEPALSGEQPNVPEGLWKKCEKCGAILYDKDLEKIFMCARNAAIISGFRLGHVSARLPMREALKNWMSLCRIGIRWLFRIMKKTGGHERGHRVK